MRLKHSKTIMYHVNSKDVEALIEEVYGRTYPIKTFENAQIDDVMEEEPSIEDENADYEEGALDIFKNFPREDLVSLVENNGGILYLIFRDMCHKGFIDSGYYIIRVQ